MFKNLNLKTLGEKEIIEKEIPLKDLWLIFDQDQVFGPYRTIDLEHAVRDFPDKFESISAANLLDNIQKQVFQHVQFQRRKPSLVSSNSINYDEKFHLLEDGQKAGPYTLSEISEKLDNQQIDLSYQMKPISSKVWIKIYQHHMFDRRCQTAKELPFSPKSYEKEQIKKAHNPSEDGVVALAFIAGGNDTGQLLTEKAPINKVSSAPEEANSHSYAKLKYSAVALALLLTVIGVNFMTSSKSENKLSKSQSNIKKVKKVTRIKKKATARKPASVKPAKKEVTRSHRPKKVAQKSRKKNVPRTRKRNMRKEPKIIAHYDEDMVDLKDPQQQKELDRMFASTEEEALEHEEDILTPEEIEAIEREGPELLELDP